jgi:hypothetical protein
MRMNFHVTCGNQRSAMYERHKTRYVLITKAIEGEILERTVMCYDYRKGNLKLWNLVWYAIFTSHETDTEF